MRDKAIVETNTDYRTKLRFLALTLLLVIFYTSLLFSATIYIDPTNTSPNQNGTITNPYNSWHSITFSDGNSYLQKRGTTFSTTSGITLSNRSNIILGAYGTGPKPIIVSSSTTSRIIRLTNSSNCIIRDLELTSSSGILGPIAIGLDGYSANNLVDSCKLHNCEYGLNMNVAVGTSGNRILRTIIHTMGDDGMYLKDMKDIEIGHCHIYNINRKYFIDPDQTYSAGDCIQLVGNQSTANALVVNIHDNILDHSSTGNKFCIIIVGDYYSGTIERNTLTGSSSTSCIYLWHTVGTMTVRNNIIQNGAYSIYSYARDLQVHYNKIINNDLGIFILPSTLTQTNLTALNNVFYNIDGACISLSNSSSTLVSKNNTFYLTSSSGKAYSTNTSPVISNYNNFNIQQSGFINNYGTLASWQSATGCDLNSFVANPLFVSPSSGNFCLQSASPCINTGTNVNLQTDFFGTAVPQGNNPDIGHHEYTTNTGGTNLAPVINNQLFQLNENSANGTAVGTVIASDPNAGQTLSYSIVGGNTGNAFTINSATGLLSVANSQALNFETTPSFPLTVRVTDNGSGNLWSQGTVTVNLLNVNESPVIANQSFSVIQNAANGTIVGTVTATDPDAGQTLTYSITAGNTGTAFYINPSTGRITVANSTAVVTGTFNLTVRATDNGSPVLFSSATVTITVTSSNQAPVISNQTFSLLQYSPNGTVVGTVAATDPNAGQTLTYAITAGNTGSSFAINASTGVITVINSTALSPQTFSLTVRVTDNGTPNLYSQATITIQVTAPANQAPVISNQSFSLVQYSPNGTLVGTMTASDPNSGQTLTFSIVSGNTNNAFAINALTGAITVNSSPALSPQVFSIAVRVTDNGTPNMYSQATATITVTTPPNLAPVISAQSFSITANSPNGTVIGTVTATDPNSGQTLAYTITGGNTGNTFALNSATGVLSVANSTNLNQGTFPLTVRVTDNGNPALWAQATVTVQVTAPANQAPVMSNQSFTLVQYSPNGTLIGTMTASDPNAGQTLTFSIISGNTGNAFAINAATGAITVNSSTALAPQTFSLTIRVTDNGTPVLYTQATATITVTTPPNLAPVISSQSFSIAANSPNGTVIGTVTASDPNAGQTLTYTITAGNTANLFALNSSSGILTVANSSGLNQGTYTLTVRVTDNGTPSLWAQATVTITVTAPVNQAPVIANQTFSLIQYSPNGTNVGTVTATDPNTWQTLVYTIIAGNTGDAFVINASTGVLTVSNSSALSPQAFSLTVRVTDNGSPSLFSQATISVNVITPPNQSPVMSNQSFSIVQYSPNGTLIGIMTASDPNAGQTLTFSLINGNTGNAFAINPVTGTITVNNATALAPQTFSLTIRTTDNGTPNLYAQAIATITVTTPPNLAPVITSQAFSITANSPNGTMIGTVTASDPNAGQTLTYTITTGNTGNLFALNSGSGIISVANSSGLNQGTYPLTVRVTDNGTPSLWAQATVTITVTPPTNQAPIISNQSFTVNENTSNGELVGNIIATDPDPGQTLTYTIISGNTNNAFLLQASTGMLTIYNSMVINYEYISVFTLSIRATDNGTGNLYSQATVTVNINNLNEAPILNQASFTVAQFASNGTFVGIVSGSDPDLGQSVTYQIISGNTSNAFNLNATNGALNVVNSSALNVNINPTFFLTVRIQDNGQPSLFSTGIIRVDVVANKNGEIVLNKPDISQDVPVSYQVYPNPTYDGIITIESETVTEDAEVQIFNTAGELIGKNQIHKSNRTSIDLSDQPAGLYILSVINNHNLFTSKVVKK